jgi:hypothetical protein
VTSRSGGDQLPRDVVWRADGDIEVRQPAVWDGVAIAIGVLAVAAGLTLAGIGVGLTRTATDVHQLLWLGVLLVVGGPLVTIRRVRLHRRETWILGPGGLRLGGPDGVTARWQDIATLELVTGRRMLTTRTGHTYVVVTSVTAYDAGGHEVLRLPDEERDDRIRAVFAMAGARGMLPPHVRFVERRA